MGAWILVNDVLNKAFWDDESGAMFDLEVDQTADTYFETVPAQSGTAGSRERPFVIAPPWETDTEYAFQVKRLPAHPSTYLYEISGDFEFFSGQSYTYVYCENGVTALFPSKDLSLRTNRDCQSLVKRDHAHGPRATPTVLNYLWSLGWQGEGTEDIRATDPAVASAIREIRGKSYSISGLPVTPMYFPAAIGMLLGLVGLSLVGPSLKINQSTINVDQEVWVMLVRPKGLFRWILFIVQLSVSMAAIALPILVASQLDELRSLVDTDKVWALDVGVTGAGVASLSMAWFAFKVLMVGRVPK